MKNAFDILDQLLMLVLRNFDELLFEDPDGVCIVELRFTRVLTSNGGAEGAIRVGSRRHRLVFLGVDCSVFAYLRW